MVLVLSPQNIIILSGVFALIVAAVLAAWVFRQPQGNKKMQEISAAVREGSNAYLSRQYKTIAAVSIPVVLALGYFIGIPAAISFIIGAVSSALAGFLGMFTAVRSNARTAAAAQHGLLRALNVAFRGG